MNILGVIPARGGSKAVPRKNIASLAGRPLITYTIEGAIASRTFGDIVVSTDDAEIANVARAAGALVPFMRPAELATDTSESWSMRSRPWSGRAAGPTTR
jgi:CMP-N,N'-diacetyllegionaminic acid synthase